MSLDSYFDKKSLDQRMKRQEHGEPTGIRWHGDVLQGCIDVRHAIQREALRVRMTLANGLQAGGRLEIDPVMDFHVQHR
jgi:hypothetical protein